MGIVTSEHSAPPMAWWSSLSPMVGHVLVELASNIREGP